MVLSALFCLGLPKPPIFDISGSGSYSYNYFKTLFLVFPEPNFLQKFKVTGL